MLDLEEGELALRRVIHAYDVPLRKVYQKAIRKEKGLPMVAWDRLCRECQIFGGSIDYDMSVQTFHRCILHEPREDGTQPLLRFNEFVEAIVRLAAFRSPEDTSAEALEFFMHGHFKFANGGNAMEGYGPGGTVDGAASREKYAQANFNFC